MTPPAFQFGQRCERAGRWRRTEDGDWVYGEIVAFGSGGVTIRTNLGRDMAVSSERVTWKPSLDCWAIWPPWLMGLVKHIEQDETRADRIGVGRLRQYPLLGDYVLVGIGRGAPLRGGFIVRSDDHRLFLSFPKDERRYGGWIDRHALDWDEKADCWRGWVQDMKERGHAGRPE